MKQINLKASSQNYAIQTRKSYRGLVLGVSAITISIGAYFFVNFLAGQEKKKAILIEEQIKSKSKIFNTVEFNSAYNFEEKLQGLAVIIKSKYDFSSALSNLAKNTFQETIYDSVEIQKKGDLMILAFSFITPNFGSLAKQIESYKNISNVQDILVEKSAITDEGISASGKITFDFKPQISETDVKEKAVEKIPGN